jgi:hypothetical protein
MSEPQMTKEQEALLDEAVKYAQLAEQQARELWELLRSGKNACAMLRWLVCRSRVIEAVH